jgi:ABC-2 type transport system ATP-binding protein
MSAAAIAITELRVRRGNQIVLDRLSLSVPRGQVCGLLGPSGSGKTTLMRAIVGVQIVEGGEVSVLGEAAGSSALRRRVAYTTQAPSVYADLSVRENLDFFAGVIGASGARIEEVLEIVELTAFEHQLVRNLSGGQRARVSVGAALLGQPELLVLDEPTVGLDPVLRGELWRTFHALAEAGATLLVSSHVMDEAERCDNLLLVRDGRILATDTPDELLRRTGAADVEGAFLSLIEGGQGL